MYEKGGGQVNDQDSKYLLEASAILEKLVHRSAQLRRSLRVDGEQEEFIEGLHSGLARVQKLIKSEAKKGVPRQRSAELFAVAGKFLFKVIEVLTRILQ